METGRRRPYGRRMDVEFSGWQTSLLPGDGGYVVARGIDVAPRR